MSTQEEIILPPAGLSFRLIGNYSNRVLFSRFSPNPTFGHSLVEDNHDDQLWNLVSTRSTYGFQLWRIRNKHTGRVLSSWRTSGEDSGAGATDNDDSDLSTRFQFSPVGKGPNVFRMMSETLDKMLPVAVFSRLGLQPEVGSAQIDPFDQQFHDFSFLLEGMVIYKIEYHINKGRILSSTPQTIPGQTFTNNTDMNQIAEISVTTTRTATSTFEHTHGFGITVGTKGEVGIPFVAKGEISIEGSTTHSWAWGSEISETTTFGARFPVETRPGQTVTAVATLTRSELDVPWTIYTKHVATGFQVETHGIFRGIHYWNVESEYFIEPRTVGLEAHEVPVRVVDLDITEVRRRVNLKTSKERHPVGLEN